ncbi:MAG TPA: hypothetical protein VHA06_08905, partial [Candidatus Angelobacter sp.]|nr:hypothetical protein [Candidatus Angelobacter sp.]
WTMILLWFAVGCTSFIFAANLQKPSLAIPIIDLALFAMVPITGSLVALRHRKRAAYIFLITGTLAACFLIAAELWDWAKNDNHLISLLRAFGFIAAFYAIPGMYWRSTARRHWQPLIQRSFSRWTKLAFGIFLFLFLLAGSLWMALYQIPYYGDCSSQYFASPKSPEHSVYTAKIIYVHDPNSFKYPPWSIAKTEQKYWGPLGWSKTFTILPYRNFKVGEEYLIEGYIRRSLVGHLFNMMETYCSLTAPMHESALELHLLKTGPGSSDGVRILGQVLKQDRAGKKEPVPNFVVALVLHHGPEIRQLTDSEGIFDYSKMSAGEYDIYIRTLPLPLRVREIGQCTGQFTLEHIAACKIVILDSNIPQQK